MDWKDLDSELTALQNKKAETCWVCNQ